MVAVPVSVSLALLATEAKAGLTVPPAVVTVTASLTLAFVHVFLKVNCAVLRLVKVQVISAPARILVAGIVNTLPANEPKLAGFPVEPLLASVQVALLNAKPDAGVSVIVTSVLIVVAGNAVGEAGVAVLGAVVLILAIFPVKLVSAKVNVPPAPV